MGQNPNHMHTKTKIQYRYLSFIDPYFYLFPSVHTLDWFPHPKNIQCLLINHVHRDIVFITHIQPDDIPHHAIHASTPNIQHIHLHLVYTIQCIHLYSMWNNTQYMYLHRVPHNEYTWHYTMTTLCTDIIPHALNTTCMTCAQYHTCTNTICTTCT